VTSKAKKTDNDWRKVQRIIKEANSIRGMSFASLKPEKGHGIAMLDQFTLAWSGVEKSEKTRTGMAVFIPKNLTKNVQYAKERCLRLDLKIYDRDVTFLKKLFYEMSNDLKICNASFQHENIHGYTRRKILAEPKIDCSLYCKQTKTAFRIQDVKRGLNCGSDRYAISYISLKQSPRVSKDLGQAGKAELKSFGYKLFLLRQALNDTWNL